MHPSRTLAFAITLLSAFAGSVPRARATEAAAALVSPREERPRLTLTFVDFAHLDGPIRALARAETASLVERLGVAVETRAVAPGDPIDPEGLTLILVNGPAAGGLSPDVMGAVQPGSSSRVLWVYPPRVAAGVGLSWSDRSRWSSRARDTFAIALARVAVHEVVHLVSPWRGHDRDGLMAATLGRSILTASQVPLGPGLSRDFTLGADAMAGAAFRLARGTPSRAR